MKAMNPRKARLIPNMKTRFEDIILLWDCAFHCIFSNPTATFLRKRRGTGSDSVPLDEPLET